MLLSVALASSLAFHSIPSPSNLALPVRDRVLFDERPGEGRIFALGSNWKMAFSPTAVSYIPRFGIESPENTPITFSFGDSGEVSRRGDVIEIDHGSFVERYLLAVDRVEQVFVLSSPPSDGTTFSIPIVTALEYRGTDAAGIRFDAPGLGTVRYGHATLIDAGGDRRSVPVDVRGDALVVEPELGYFARARYPLTIDPLIQTIVVDGGSDLMRDPDVSYSGGHDTYAVVYEDATSASDIDLIVHRYDHELTFEASAAIDLSTDSAIDPSIAESNGQFFIAWENVGSVLSANRIKGRSYLATGSAVGEVLEISALTAKGESDPDVGGAYGGTSRFFVVWRQGGGTLGFGPPDFAHAVCTPTGVTFGPEETWKSTLGGFGPPAITPSSGPGHRFLIAGIDGTFEMEFFAYLENGDKVSPFGLGLGSDSPLSNADAVGDGFEAAIVFEVANGAFGQDIAIRRYGLDFAVVELPSQFYFTGSDAPATQHLHQTAPAIAFDGTRYTVVYAEGSSPSQARDLFATTFIANDDGLTFLEKHAPVAVTAADESEVSIWAPRLEEQPVSMLGTRMIAWSHGSGSAADVNGGLYSALQPGGITVRQTGCGTTEPLITFGNQALLPVGGEATLFAANFGSGLLQIGIAADLAMCPGQAGCRLGVLPLISIPIGVSSVFIPFEIPAEPALVGAGVSMQLFDLLPSAANGPLCGPPKFTKNVRVSDTLDLKFQ